MVSTCTIDSDLHKVSNHFVDLLRVWLLDFRVANRALSQLSHFQATQAGVPRTTKDSIRLWDFRGRKLTTIASLIQSLGVPCTSALVSLGSSKRTCKLLSKSLQSIIRMPLPEMLKGPCKYCLTACSITLVSDIIWLYEGYLTFVPRRASWFSGGCDSADKSR